MDITNKIIHFIFSLFDTLFGGETPCLGPFMHGPYNNYGYDDYESG